MSDTRDEILSRILIIERNLLSKNIDEKKLQAAFNALDDLWDASGGSEYVAFEMASDQAMAVLVRLLLSSSYAGISNFNEIREMAGSCLSVELID